MAAWYVYIVRCADGTLYTGITNDVEKRIDKHNSGTGSKYTAARRPVTLVHLAPAADRSEASRMEREMKRLSRAQKLALVARQAMKGEEEGRCPMGDKGGKKDKAKSEKQKANKQSEEAKKKQEKQPKRKP